MKRAMMGRRGGLVVGTVVVMGAGLMVAIQSCAHSPQFEGCGSDKDCKLERVCEAGRCVWPRTPHAAAPVPADPARPEKPSSVTTWPAEQPAVSTAEGMFRFEPQHRGRSPYRLPTTRPQITWSYETAGAVTSSPVISSGGLVLAGSHDGRLHALDAQGKAAWSFPTTDLVFGSPAISALGVAYVGSDDDHLYAVDSKTGRFMWKLRLGTCRQTTGVGPEASRCDVDGGPTIGTDGMLYTGGDAIYAINPEGTIRWRFPTNGHVSNAPAVAPDGTVVAGSQDNLIYALTKEGSKRWDFRARDDVESTPAIEEDGTAYVGSDDNRLYALSPTGQLSWAFTTGDDVRASPAIGHDGTVYVGSFDGLLYAIRRDGTLAWSFRTGDRIVSSALVDATGAILFGSEDDRLYALEPDGKLRWSVELGGDIDSSPILAPDGTIYVGCDDKKVYALR